MEEIKKFEKIAEENANLARIEKDTASEMKLLAKQSVKRAKAREMLARNELEVAKVRERLADKSKKLVERKENIKDTLKTSLIYTLLVDAVFVPSWFLYAHFRRFPFLKAKMHMFHNAVDPPEMSIEPHRPARFAVVAKLSKRKQVDKVLRVFHHLRQLPWQLHIGGFGPELENLQKLARTLQIDDRVYFAGHIDPYRFLLDKDVGILYSKQEPFGYAIIEYMAMSCAVVASRVGGVPEIITHEDNGLLVDSENPQTLEAALRSLIVHPERIERLSLKGYNTVLQDFNQGVIFSKIEDRLTQLVRQEAV